jgi:RNA polymerase sigma-70 factor (family 1)
MSGKLCDYNLVRLLQKGNVAAFDTLFEVYSPKLFGFAMKYFKNEGDSEELVQDVFVQVWEHRQSLKSELSFKSYLFTIALNQIRKHFNKKAIFLRYLESLRQDPELTYNETIQNDYYESTLQQVNLIIEQMPPRRREIFLKSKLEGRSSKEVAAELNISAGTVDNQVSEALRFIRDRLSNEKAGLLIFAFMFVY